MESAGRPADTQTEEKKQEAETTENEQKEERNCAPNAVEMQPGSQSEATADPNSPSPTAASADTPNGSNAAHTSTHNSDLLSSCTLIEGLPFPVEYYVRTTRRMASSRSSVDINAVIQSQLSRGRGRRKSPRSQTPVLGHVTSVEKPSCRRRGPRGRRGRRRVRDSGSDSKVHGESQSNPEPESTPLTDSQLYLDSPENCPDFRRRHNQAGVVQANGNYNN